MAEQDFFITIRTTADTAGIKQTEAELRKLGVQVESIKQAGAQVAGGAGLGSLAGRIAGGVLGGAGIYGLSEGIRDYAAQLNKATAEIDKQASKVVDLGRAWAEAARAATSTEDIRKIAQSGMGDIEAFSNRITQIATQDIPAAMDSMTDIVTRAFNFAFTGDPNQKGPHQQIAENLMTALEQQETILRKQKIEAIELAETYKGFFDEIIAKPFSEAMAETNRNISDLENAQMRLDKGAADYLEQYNKITQELRVLEAIQEKLLSLERQRTREAQEQAKATEATARKRVEVETKAFGGELTPMARLQKQAAMLTELGKRRDLTPAEEKAVRDAWFEINRQITELQGKAGEEYHKNVAARYAGPTAQDLQTPAGVLDYFNRLSGKRPGTVEEGRGVAGKADPELITIMKQLLAAWQ